MAEAKLKQAEALEAERRAAERAHLKTEETARQAAEAEAEHAAVAAARKAEADAKVAALPAQAGEAAAKAIKSQCATDFSELFESDTIRFNLRSDDIAPSTSAFLDAVAAIAKRCEGFAITIDGHSDRSGAARYNIALSQARADAVRGALASRGIAASRLISHGYGSERPFAPANNRAAFALNRRVDLGFKADVPAGKDRVVATSKAETDSVHCGDAFGRLFVSDKIRFKPNSAKLSKGSRRYIDAIAEVAKHCRGTMLSIDGHADRLGTERFNQHLSERRAKAVQQALIARGVMREQMSVHGYGSARPFDPGATSSAFALNRRVDFGYSQMKSASTGQ